jgi:TPR repeat protein
VLAFCYRNGTGVRVDQQRAHRWAQLAAEAGRCVMP